MPPPAGRGRSATRSCAGSWALGGVRSRTRSTARRRPMRISSGDLAELAAKAGTDMLLITGSRISRGRLPPAGQGCEGRVARPGDAAGVVSAHPRAEVGARARLALAEHVLERDVARERVARTAMRPGGDGARQLLAPRSIRSTRRPSAAARPRPSPRPRRRRGRDDGRVQVGEQRSQRVLERQRMAGRPAGGRDQHRLAGEPVPIEDVEEELEQAAVRRTEDRASRRSGRRPRGPRRWPPAGSGSGSPSAGG